MKLRQSNKDKYKFNETLNIVKFISYDGEFPNLCSGELIISIDDIIIKFPKYSLRTGGTVISENIDGALHFETSSGPWTIDNWPKIIPDDEKLRNAILELINANITYGCCGGCI